jgi:hypothetical protein
MNKKFIPRIIKERIENRSIETPTIPDWIFRKMPSLLKESCSVFDSPRERDVFLLGALTVMSGMFSEISGIYRDERVSPNLYSFIIAPPASGKGAFRYAQRLGDALHEALLNSPGTMLSPDKEVRKTLFIPANTSSAMLYDHFKANGEKGIIFETEADALGATLNQEWANFSYLLRQGFHHEKASKSRIGDGGRYMEIKNPKLSIGLTGTPNQLKAVIPDVENGLFSRFLFYTFSEQGVWRDPRPVKGKPELGSFFNEKGQQMKEVAEFLESHPFQLLVSDKIWDAFSQLFRAWHDDPRFQHDNLNEKSSVRRLGLITYRLMMIFTALRQAEEQEKTAEAEVRSIDYVISREIIKVLKVHLDLLLDNLPSPKRPMLTFSSDSMLDRFWNALPSGEFRRKVVADFPGLCPRSVDAYLKKLVLKGRLERQKHGYYRKVG